jgi:hypothetical protein
MKAMIASIDQERMEMDVRVSVCLLRKEVRTRSRFFRFAYGIQQDRCGREAIYSSCKYEVEGAQLLETTL